MKAHAQMRTWKNEREEVQGRHGEQRATYELKGDHDYRFEGELSIADFKEIFQGGTKEFHHKGVVTTHRTKVVHHREANFKERAV